MLWTNLCPQRARTVPVREAARLTQQAAIRDGLAGSIRLLLSGFRSGPRQAVTLRSQPVGRRAAGQSFGPF